MSKGWILLHRKLLKNPVFLKPELLQLFVYCLLKANHKESEIIFNGKMQTVKRGSFITGRKSMALELKQNEASTYKRLKILENLEFLNIKSNNKFSTVTVVNYDLYQQDNLKSNSKSNNQVTTREQPSNTNNNDNNIDTNVSINKREEKNKTNEELEKSSNKGNIPYQKIKDLYNNNTLSFSKVKLLTDERKKRIKARWNTDKEFQSLDFWLNLFLRAEKSDFLTGRKRTYNSKYPNWNCDFDYIVSQKGFTNITEGKHDNPKEEKGKVNGQFGNIRTTDTGSQNSKYDFEKAFE